MGRQARNLRVAQEPSSVVNILDSARWRFVAYVLLSLSSFCDLIHSLHSVALVYAVITPVARMFLSAQATSGKSESAFSLSSFQQWNRRGSVQPRLLNMLTTLAASQPKDKDGLRALVNQLAEHLFPPPKQATSTKEDRDSTQRQRTSLVMYIHRLAQGFDMMMILIKATTMMMRMRLLLLWLHCQYLSFVCFATV